MADRQAAEARHPTARTAWALALASLAPFLALSIAISLAGKNSGWMPLLGDAFRTWSAIALGFLGGIRWGLALGREQTVTLALAAIPVIVGWLALFAPPAIGIAVVMLAHCAQGAWDSLSAGRTMPDWFAMQRIAVTLVIAATHIAVFLVMF